MSASVPVSVVPLLIQLSAFSLESTHMGFEIYYTIHPKICQFHICTYSWFTPLAVTTRTGQSTAGNQELPHEEQVSEPWNRICCLARCNRMLLLQKQKPCLESAPCYRMLAGYALHLFYGWWKFILFAIMAWQYFFPTFNTSSILFSKIII